jgi:hypothetical protein
MPVSLSKRAARTVQSEMRVMTAECEKVKRMNLAQGVCADAQEERRNLCRHP